VFADALTVGWRLSRRVQREVERRTRHVLHLANLPTATDVRRLSEQVSALQRELRELQDRRP
jgi:polyhydroxyalkanoate synthesis regulator phasin